MTSSDEAKTVWHTSKLSDPQQRYLCDFAVTKYLSNHRIHAIVAVCLCFHHESRLAKIDSGMATAGPEPKEPVVPIIFNSRPYVESLDQEVQCDLIEDQLVHLSTLRTTISGLESALNSIQVEACSVVSK